MTIQSSIASEAIFTTAPGRVASTITESQSPCLSPGCHPTAGGRLFAPGLSLRGLGIACGKLLLAVLAVVAPSAANAQFDFVTNSGAITITKYTGSGGAVVIPSVTNGLPVTGVGTWAFYGAASVTSVTIPASITSIGQESFYRCAGLTDITIPSSVTTIGTDPLADCTNLTAITVSAANPAYCSVDGVLFDKGVTKLIQFPGAKAGGYTVPSGVTNIAFAAFYNCNNLTNLVFPASLTTLEDYAATYCSRLAIVTFSSGIRNIKSWAFSYATSLASVTIPGSVTNIGDYSFRGCTNLASATISDGVTTIGLQAFVVCRRLASVLIPASVTNIGNSAFADCTAMTNISVSAANPAYKSMDGVLFNKAMTTLIQCPAGRSGDYNVPAGVAEIGTYAFSGCGLANIVVPSSVAYVRDYAFHYCVNLLGVYFMGNSPPSRATMFTGATLATVYYMPGTTGWTATFSGRPALLWNPQIANSGPSFGVRTNRFGFMITGTSNLVVVVEATTNVVKTNWVAVGTNTLTTGQSYFSDSKWTNYPARYYRLRSP